MNNKLLTAILVLAALIAGWLIGGSRSDTGTGDSPASGSEREILYWKAPMDPSYRRDGPGKSPMGMDLVPVYADEFDGDEGVVAIDPTVVNNLGVRTATAERRRLSRRIETVGYVGYDEDTVSQVNTRVEGWVESLSVRAEGDPVVRGQVLFELYSPTLVNAQEEFLATLGGSSRRLIEASRERLAALGMNASEIARLERERSVRQRVPVVAGVDGFVSFLGIREGAFVTPATNVVTIAGLDSVWVEAEVLERQSMWVEAGQRAEVVVDHSPESRWQGVVNFVHPELDPATRTLKVRFRIDNTDRELRPNRFTRVTVYAAETGPVVSIPREALILGGRVDRVVVALGGGRFRAQPVEVGIESGDLVEIRSGLSAGERVVTSGQFLIDSESNIDSALGRLSDHDGMGHESMDHETMNHESMDHETMDHESMDHGSMERDTMDHDAMDHADMDHESMNHRPAETGAGDTGERAGEHEGHRP